jgi:Family of unknown function (DUF6011)
MIELLALPVPTVRCVRCGRPLRAVSSRDKGYGPTCYARVARAARVLLASTNSAAQRAGELLLDAGLARLPGHRGRVFRTVSSNGSTTYLTSPDGCTCKAGLHARLCYHAVAATILAA